MAPSLWHGSLKFPVVAMQARTPGLLGKEKKTIKIHVKFIPNDVTSPRAADIVLPVCVAFLWSRQITVVGAVSVVEWTHGVMMPILGFKLQLFTIPNS